jgi:cation diffusion facilitator CzcD-associated flavoprotein CzcO
MYRSARLISSKPMTQFRDFPMSRELPDYPTHEQALEYLRSYARHFGLYERIRFGTRVERATPAAGGWEVRLGDGSARVYEGLVLSHGFHWAPRRPALPGSFDGEVMHSCDYEESGQLAGQRVLVVGGGNSGCDIAVEAARHAVRAHLSLRRGYHVVPKHLLGFPADQLGEWGLRLRLPLGLRRLINGLLLRIAVGDLVRAGLPRPDHRLLESHPIVNSRLVGAVRDGQLAVHGEVERLDGRHVVFAGGDREEIDLVILATGYHLSFPFLDEAVLPGREGRPELYLHVFHPERDDLAVCGMIQPDSGVWWLADDQAALIASFIAARRERPERAAWFRGLVRGEQPDLGNGLHYVDSARHHTEVEHFSYARRLRWLRRRLDR